MTENHKMIKLLALVGLLAAVTSADLMPIQNRSLSLSCQTSRMINGKETSIKKYPYQVSIHVRGIGQICGGSIISKYWVLTAAQCLFHEKFQYTIRAGTSHAYKGGSIHRVRRIVINKHYGRNKWNVVENDIGLIRVKESFRFDKTRQPVEFYHQDEETDIESIGVITGWGETGCGYRPTLSVVKLPIITKGRCNFHYAYRHGIADYQICATHEEGNRGPCKGATGSPMTINGRLAGIYLWSEGCARPDKPGVYTEVSHYHNWIKSTMCW